MKKGDKNEKGMVLVTVIIFGAIIIMLGVALLSTGVMEVKSGNFFERNTQAYYVAKAGADIIQNQIVEGNITVDSDNGTVQSFTGTIGSDQYTVEVNRDDTDTKKIMIDATGSASGVRDNVKLILKENVQVSGGYNVDTSMAVFVESSMSISSLVKGDIVTNSIANNSIDLVGSGDTKVEGTIFVGKNGDPQKVITVPSWFDSSKIPLKKVLSEIRIYPVPEPPSGLPTPANESYNEGQDGVFDGVLKVSGGLNGSGTVYKYIFYLNEDVYLDKISITSNDILRINVGTVNRTIVVKNFEGIQGNIIIEGSGTLSLYVLDSFIAKGKYNWESDNDNNLINTEKLKIYIVNKNNTMLNISGGDAQINGLLYAPNSTVTVTGSGIINGSLVAKSATVSGSGKVIYSNPGFITIPGIGGGTTSVTYEKLNYE